MFGSQSLHNCTEELGMMDEELVTGDGERGDSADHSGEVDLNLLRKAQVVRFTASLLLAMVPLYASFLIVAGAGIGPPVLAILIAGIGVLPVVYLAGRQRNLLLMGNWTVFLLWIVLLIVGGYNGGTTSPTMFWLLSVPLFAVLLADTRSAVVWTVVAIAHLGTFHVVPAEVFADYQVLDPTWHSRFVIFGRVTLLVVLALVGLILDRARERAQRQEAKKQRELAVSERRFRQLIEASPDAIAVRRGGQVVYANPSLRRLLEEPSAGDLQGRRFHDLVHPDDRDAATAREALVLEEGGPSPAAELRFLLAEGGTVTMEVVSLLLEMEGGEAVVTLGRDISGRKAMIRQMVQLDRLAVYGTLASGVGHEINNPLAYSLLNLRYATDSLERRAADLASSRGADADALRELLERIEAEDREISEAMAETEHGLLRVRDVVRDLRALARTEPVDGEAVDLADVVRRSVDIVANEIRHRAALTVDVAQMPLREASASRVGQLALNLLLNAAHAIAPGEVQDNEIQIRAFLEAGDLILEVQDTGTGIPDDDLDRIFDPFFTTRPIGQGTGLGLFVCRQIVDSLEGRISLDSEVGVGTTVRVELPTSPPTEKQESTNEAVVARGCGLIIDNEPQICKMVSRALAPHHSAVTASSGAEALALIEDGEHFDFILCDLMMPNMTGMAFYEVLHDHDAQLAERVIFITGGAFTPEAREFLDSVSPPCIEKPFEVEQVCKAIAALAS